MNCRHCSTPLSHTFLNLGFAPPSNAYLTASDLRRTEKYYPLCIKVCAHCWLVQTEDYADADELFSESYAYFSSTSTSWLRHAERYVDQVKGELALDVNSFVVEVASNDGYLLKNFVAAGIPCLGIEPTASTAAAAESLGVPVLREFFGEELGKRLAASGRRADLIIGNNVYAHVPDINDFTRGMKAVLKAGGTITLEFPHVMRLLEHCQFDTVYHEHFSYLSYHVVERIFRSAGLKIWKVEELSTHGGSLRIFGCHMEDARPTHASVQQIADEEQRRGLQEIRTYQGFQARADRLKNDLLAYLLAQKREGRRVAAYGAAAKGNTLLNYAGVRPDLLPFVCDAAASKQDHFMPGSHIPIVSPGVLRECEVDDLLILPWNIADEVIEQISVTLKRRPRFVTAVPNLQIRSL